MLETEFYNKLREEQIKIIDAGYPDLRFYKIYAHLLVPVKDKMNEIKLKLAQAIK